jgi:hypothetical protein
MSRQAVGPAEPLSKCVEGLNSHLERRLTNSGAITPLLLPSICFCGVLRVYFIFTSLLDAMPLNLADETVV